MRGMKNKKLKAILSITGYFLLVIALCVSASIVFHNTYYDSVYVSGGSMYPTLKGSNMVMSSYGFDVDEDGSTADFGIVDSHKSAINNIKRFSIVSTYFSTDFNENGELSGKPNQKIKRVIALPGETFKIENSKLYIKKGEDFEYIPYTFTIEPSVEMGDSCKDITEHTLLEDEYWLLGDHRSNSNDCNSLIPKTGDFHKSTVKKSYLIGVLVAIEGQAKLKLKSCTCDKCGNTYTTGVLCQNCGNRLTREFDLVNKKYHWPKYY